MDSENEATILERNLRAIYGAYVYLRTHDLAAVSTTSRLLRGGETAWLAGRARDELAELRGAVEGTHGHGGGRDDVVLEAYQALYWLLVLAVVMGEEYDAIRPHELLAAGGPEGVEWAWPDEAGQRQQALRAGFVIVGHECRRGGVAAAEPAQRDLAELRAKPYLAPYWAVHDATP